MTTDDATRTVRRIAHSTLGAGAEPKRAARRARTEALGRLTAAAQRGEPAEALATLEAEFRAADATFKAAMGW
jgi:hypothetical protein